MKYNIYNINYKSVVLWVWVLYLKEEKSKKSKR